MRSPGEMARLRTPDFYRVLWVTEIPLEALGVRPGGLPGELYLVEFADGELSDPLVEPIGVFGDGKGDRQYIWRGGFWGEADRKLLEGATQQVRDRINQPRPGVTARTRLLYRLDSGREGGWDGGGY